MFLNVRYDLGNPALPVVSHEEILVSSEFSNQTLRQVDVWVMIGHPNKQTNRDNDSEGRDSLILLVVSNVIAVGS